MKCIINSLSFSKSSDEKGRKDISWLALHVFCEEIFSFFDQSAPFFIGDFFNPVFNILIRIRYFSYNEIKHYYASHDQRQCVQEPEQFRFNWVFIEYKWVGSLDGWSESCNEVSENKVEFPIFLCGIGTHDTVRQTNSKDKYQK